MKGFHVETLLSQLDTISQAELDRLPVGMIQLDREGKVLRYNRAEGDLARRDPQAQVGRSFFDDVAPCTRVREFHGRFCEGVARRALNETFAYTFAFAHGKVDVVITLFYSASTDTVWVLVSREGHRAPRSA